MFSATNPDPGFFVPEKMYVLKMMCCKKVRDRLQTFDKEIRKTWDRTGISFCQRYILKYVWGNHVFVRNETFSFSEKAGGFEHPTPLKVIPLW